MQSRTLNMRHAARYTCVAARRSVTLTRSVRMVIPEGWSKLATPVGRTRRAVRPVWSTRLLPSRCLLRYLPRGTQPVAWSIPYSATYLPTHVTHPHLYITTEQGTGTVSLAFATTLRWSEPSSARTPTSLVPSSSCTLSSHTTHCKCHAAETHSWSGYC